MPYTNHLQRLTAEFALVLMAKNISPIENFTGCKTCVLVCFLFFQNQVGNKRNRSLVLHVIVILLKRASVVSLLVVILDLHLAN